MDEKITTTQPNTTPEATPAASPDVSAPPVAQESVASAGARKFDSTFSELKAIQTTVTKFKPGDVLIPILSLISLALLTIYIYIPMISSGLEFRTQSKDVDAKITQLNKLNSELDALNITTLQADVASARSVIPFSLQVSDFLGYIDEAAKSKNLEFREILAGDIVVRSSTEAKGIDPVIRGVSGPLKYFGTLTQITDFLDQIQDASPFIVSTDQVKLKKSTSGDKWELSLTVTGYYINQASIPKTDIYTPFTNYTQYHDILDVFDVKSQKLSK